jgi:hypothetical protein
VEVEGDLRQPIPFGKYYLLERINVGGMAEVFKAKATGVEGFERLVAVKRILPSIAEDEEFITMFVDEAKIAVQLTHANIGQIFDLGRVEGSYYIALEYVSGKDMRAIFNRARQRSEILPIALSCYVVMKLCEGLDYAHNKHDNAGTFLNLVHRDVSPQNILVSYEGEVKIIDFGIAKAAGKIGRTQAGILKGKFGYMSPEQVLGLEIDRRSDVFGVGICLYELLTGERLFIAETDFGTLEKVRSADVVPPSAQNPRITEELEQIVMRALARDREFRYQTALQLHDDLQTFMHTSASTFTRKDLREYMRRVFGEEIDKESARDLEYAQLDPSAGVGNEHGLGIFDALAPVSTVSELPAHPVSFPLSASVAPGPVAAPIPRQRKATLLGIPQLNRESMRAPSVPRLVPNPQSVPPFANSHLPLLGAAEAGMEWDDEELSTQIYDKPDEALDSLQASLPPENHDLQARAFPPLPDDNDGRASAGDTWQANLTAAASRPYSPSLPPSAARVQTAAWERRQRGRPMLVAVVAVIAIIGCIVMGLLLFGQREPATVNLSTTPSRVEVTVDGRSLGTSSSPFVIGELSPGRRHDIVVGSAGYRPWSRSVELASGEVMTIPDVQLERIETGFSLDSAPSGASVFVDDQKLAQRTPAKVSDLAPGDHRIRLEHEGHAPWESVLHASTGTLLPLPLVTLQPLAAERPVAEVHSTVASTSRWHRSSGSSTGSNAEGDDPPPAAREPRSSNKPKDDDDSPEPSGANLPTAPSRSETPTPTEPATVTQPHEATAESAEPASKGTLRVNTRPWSQVFIDGKAYGSTPRMNIALPAGAHVLMLVNDEFSVKKTVDVTIEPGKVETVILNLLE